MKCRAEVRTRSASTSGPCLRTTAKVFSASKVRRLPQTRKRLQAYAPYRIRVEVSGALLITRSIA
jgi:hypothetical protein